MEQKVPEAGQWPVGPQVDQPILKEKIWVDGCFDFAHHGHAGAMLQARRLGKELWVGVHSDEEIMVNKGPTVMTLQERVNAVEACRWSTQAVPQAPYVTSLPWVSHYGCQYVVHGDDITSDENGEDCYRYVKAAGRFLVVKRTPGISTTDLVGRMLLYSKDHFIRSFADKLQLGRNIDHQEASAIESQEMLQRIEDYATNETGMEPGCQVYLYREAGQPDPVSDARLASQSPVCSLLVDGQAPLKGQRVVYVDGGFDLFSSGHIEFLRLVAKSEAGFHSSTPIRDTASGQKSYIVAGIHDDSTVNRRKGLNYPIMNIYERGLCLLQCRYIDAVVFCAPYAPTAEFLASLPFGTPQAVYHGPNSLGSSDDPDPYSDARRLGIYREVESHPYDNVNAQEIVSRILASRDLYEARQKAKEAKSRAEQSV